MLFLPNSAPHLGRSHISLKSMTGELFSLHRSSSSNSSRSMSRIMSRSMSRSRSSSSYCIVVVVDLGVATLLTSQVISVAFYSERKKSDKFCSETLISACGSFTAVNLLYGIHGFTSLPKDFYALKKSIDPGRV